MAEIKAEDEETPNSRSKKRRLEAAPQAGTAYKTHQNGDGKVVVDLTDD